MPIFDQGYRPYEGSFRGRALIWWRITLSGLRTARRWPVVAILVCAAFPLMLWLIVTYGLLSAEGWLAQFANATASREGIGIGDGMYFQMLSVEVFFAVLLLMVVGSGQIAEDFRTGALQIYFSKPITHLDYVLGKLGTVVLAGSLVTALPSLILYGAYVLFSDDWSFLTENPFLLGKALLFSLVISLVLGALVLAISSLGRRGRMVGLVFGGGYFFTMMLGHVLPRIFRVDGVKDTRLKVVHIGNCLDAVGSTLLEPGKPLGTPTDTAWAIAAGLLLLSVTILSRKVKAVEVVS